MTKANRIAFIAYLFKESDGVGSARSRSLAKYLKERGYALSIITKYAYEPIFSRSVVLWGLYCLLLLIFNKYDKVYVSCSPFRHLIFIWLGCRLKKNKMIIDFRDPWSINIKTGYGKYDNRVNPFKLHIAQYIEKVLYKHCEYFLVCTPAVKSIYSQLFKDDSKIKLMMNGHDLDCSCLVAEKTGDSNKDLRLVCLGKFSEYGQDKAAAILNELSRYIRRNKDINLIIEFIGTEIEPNSKLVRQFGLEEKTIFHPRMSYENAIKIAAGADIGICVIRDETIDFGTKIFDYIGLGLPVLDCFSEESQFRNYFFAYMTRLCEKRKKLTADERKKYKRENIFKQCEYVFN